MSGVSGGRATTSKTRCAARTKSSEKELIGFGSARHPDRSYIDQQPGGFIFEFLLPSKAILLSEGGSGSFVARHDNPIRESGILERAGDSFRHAAASAQRKPGCLRNSADRINVKTAV